MGSNPNNYNYNRNPYAWPKPYHGYESKDVTVSGATDYSLKTNTELFSFISSPLDLTIKNGSASIGIRLGDVDADSIPLAANAEFRSTGLLVGDIFVTASGSASFHVTFFGWR
jgi:hypothetical protein